MMPMMIPATQDRRVSFGDNRAGNADQQRNNETGKPSG